jgi:hypothetical protein
MFDELCKIGKNVTISKKTILGKVIPYKHKLYLFDYSIEEERIKWKEIIQSK